MSGVEVDLLAAGASRLPSGLACDGSSLGYAAGMLVVVRELRSGRLVGCVNGHRSPVRAIVLNQGLLVSSATGGKISVHRVVADGLEELGSVELGADAGSAVVAMWKKEFVASIGLDSVLRCWRLEEGKMVLASELQMDDLLLPESISIGAVGELLLIAVGGSDKKLRLIAMTDRKELKFAPIGLLPGHRDWIRSVDFSEEDDTGAVWLATGSNDHTAHVWHAKVHAGDEEPVREILDMNVHIFKTELGGEYGVCWLVFEKKAILSDHTDQITAVRWFGSGSSLGLVTSSMDSSLALWKTDEDDAWRPFVRLGLLGGASAHALGLFCAVVTQELEVFASAFNGAIFNWAHNPESGEWTNKLAPQGHADIVFDAKWDPRGRFAASCSGDKTTRIWGQFEGTWRELSRPQVHGHPVFGLTFAGSDGTDIVSVSEEKMARLLQAPKWFYRLLHLPGEELRPDAAELPALGLSNKPLEDVGGDGLEEESSTAPAAKKKPISDDRAPFEEELMQDRLWPEIAKLYAHGSDLSCVSSTRDGSILATAAKANTTAQAAVVIWNMATRTKIEELAGHDLTVTAIEFSPCGSSLCTVSRDRSFRVYRVSPGDTKPSFDLVSTQPGAHSRIINCTEWIYGTSMLATGSRDKTVKIWTGLKDGRCVSDGAAKSVKFGAPVTAMSWCSLGLAVGLEDGSVHQVRIDVNGDVGSPVSLPTHLWAAGRVRSLHWRPRDGDSETVKTEQLLIASEDQSVRIYSVTNAF